MNHLLSLKKSLIFLAGYPITFELSGMFLITPGVITDVVGILIVLPFTRFIFKDITESIVKKKISNGELITYIQNNVSKVAFSQNRDQDPMLAGDPDKVLMRYK